MTSFGDGTYQVGTAAGDVTAGLYRTAGPTEGMPCYWARTKDSTGKADALIADGYPTGPTTVTVRTPTARSWRRSAHSGAKSANPNHTSPGHTF
ncbi:MAG TPA: hypothetical protein VMS16_06185 [Mycobacterium sp.]|nr:hypothetical protein [Mycobacterium sp.]